MTKGATEVLSGFRKFIPGGIAEMHYGDDVLSVSVGADPENIKVVFKGVLGFRLLDERDLNEFWDHDDYEPNAWMYVVHSGGWFDLEKTRPHFLTGYMASPTEYLVATENECLSILAESAPILADEAI